MDLQTVVNLVGGAALAALGWFARTIWEAQVKLREDHEAHRLHVAEKYTKTEAFEKAVDKFTQDMKTGFDKVFERLDRKQDKQ